MDDLALAGGGSAWLSLSMLTLEAWWVVAGMQDIGE